MSSVKPGEVSKVHHPHHHNKIQPTKIQPTKVTPTEIQKHERVTFQSETDGRANFLNQSDFHAFCKQRDIFYAIKDSWMTRNKNEKQQFTSNFSSTTVNNFHHSSSSNFSSSSGGSSKRITLRSSTPTNYDQGTYSPLQQKVKQLLQLNSSPSNLSHLASLCISQYILDSSNCKNNGEMEMDDDNFRQFFQSNPLKFKQLENRLENKFVNEPLTFLKYFVDLANWPDFNQHLIDRCILEITDADALVERQEVRSSQDLVEGLNKCRILAQVLGFLYFRPYRQSLPNNYTGNTLRSIEFETYMMNQVSLRSYHQPPINLMEKIYESLSHKKLVFTLPWIIDFLSQADSVTYHLPSYKKVISLIGQLYRTILTGKCDTGSSSSSNRSSSSSKYKLARENKTFLRLYCGRLFQINDFPTAVVFSDDPVEDAKLNHLLDSQVAVVENEDHEDDEIVVDSFSAIGDALISIVFDKKMSDMETILSDNNSRGGGWTGSSNSSSIKTPVTNNTTPINILPVKHIRPIPANSITSKSKLSAAAAQLQNEQEEKMTNLQTELEACFFQNHPPSVKRTVEFISDRVASNFVKNLRNNIYPEFRNECMLKKIFGDEAVVACQQKILLEFKKCLPKAEQAVDLLIGGGCINEGALMACKKICARRSVDKVQDWVNSHINKDLFVEVNVVNIRKSPSMRNQNLLVQDTIVANTDQQQQQQQQQPKFRALVKLQQLLQKLYKREVDIDLDEFLPFLTRDQLGNSNLAVNSTVDIALSVLTFCPQHFSQKVEDSFISFWRQVWKSRMKILCPRNILLFEQSAHPDATWAKLSCLVNKLVKANVMNLQELEEQCLGFLRHNWPPVVLSRVSEFSKQISANSTMRTEEGEVLSWISWACSDNPDFH